MPLSDDHDQSGGSWRRGGQRGKRNQLNKRYISVKRFCRVTTYPDRHPGCWRGRGGPWDRRNQLLSVSVRPRKEGSYSCTLVSTNGSATIGVRSLRLEKALGEHLSRPRSTYEGGVTVVRHSDGWRTNDDGTKSVSYLCSLAE